MNVSIVTALIAAWVPILGLFITNALERRRALRLRELEFRLDRCKEFLQALCEFGANRTYATQLHFTNSLNVVLSAGGKGLRVGVAGRRLGLQHDRRSFGGQTRRRNDAECLATSSPLSDNGRSKHAPASVCKSL
jgi:hypothetical protein